jgi:hypothetical protein
MMSTLSKIKNFVPEMGSLYAYTVFTDVSEVLAVSIIRAMSEISGSHGGEYEDGCLPSPRLYNERKKIPYIVYI